MPISPEEFVSRLAATAVQNDAAYARLSIISEAQREYEATTLKFKGYRALSDAFKCLFLETIEIINVEIRPKISSPLSELYSIFIPRLLQSFQALCGAEVVSIRGYPYHGYALIRNIFDGVILTSAALQKITDFYSIEGVDPKTPFDPETVWRLRKTTEFEVRKIMTGKDSGLPESTIGEIAKWDALFDAETHGARLSLTHSMGWMKGTAALPVVPRWEPSAFALFMNRYCEVAWMVHRLVPLIQPPGIFLSDSWADRWSVIDDSFQQCVASLTQQLGKSIGAAIVDLVNAKYPFNAKTTFPL